MKENEDGEIIERLKNEKSITALFNNIISFNMITILAFYCWYFSSLYDANVVNYEPVLD